MTREKAILYRVEKLENLLISKAHYKHFAFDRHTHDDFSLGLMEEGIQTFYYRGEACYAPPGSMLTVNPDEIHDGRSADSCAYRYRIIFIPFGLMQRIGEEMIASGGAHYFRSPVTFDSEQAASLAALFQMMDNGETGILELQNCFFDLLVRILQKHGTEKSCLSAVKAIPRSIKDACEYIHEMAREDISLDDLAAVAGLSRFHFLHLFSATKGISPYAMLLNRRLHLAKNALAIGVPIADAALDAGFADQSHLSRRFKAAFGVTPGQYQKAVARSA